MKKIITLFSALVFSLAVAAQALEGSWTGKLNVMGNQLNIVFNIAKGDGGGLTCTLDSPDQGAKGIPAEITVTDGTKVKISVATLMAEYDGELADGTIKGNFSQGGMSFPLDLKPGRVERRCPQAPKEPYPYATEEVTFTNEADKATLCGTLAYPVDFGNMKKGSVPLVVMVTGSGLQNRDEEVFDHKPFLVLADFLARNGIASLRYDDRGVGCSTCITADATTENYMKDALAAVNYARSRGDFGPVGVHGHSEGGAAASTPGAGGCLWTAPTAPTCPS